MANVTPQEYSQASSCMNGVYSFVGGQGFLISTHCSQPFYMKNVRPTSFSPLATWDKGGVAPSNEGDYHGRRRYSAHPQLRYHIVLDSHVRGSASQEDTCHSQLDIKNSQGLNERTKNRNSPNRIRPEPDVLKSMRNSWEYVQSRMRREPTSRWLTEYNFYTHPSFLSIFRCSQATDQGGGVFESCAVTEGVILECQSVFAFWSLFYSILYLYLCNI